MPNNSIITSMQVRISELSRERQLLARALAGLSNAAGAPRGSKMSGAQKTRAAPEGTFNMVRDDVLKLLAKKSRSVNHLIATAATKKKVDLSAAAKRVMYARIYQHLLQLEGAGSAKKKDDGWVRAG